ncbi:hypothetical protein AB837_00412 [bacterium AB1]|nr:hypothetical protein AB837_00412 [bacterium AB1]
MYTNASFNDEFQKKYKSFSKKIIDMLYLFYKDRTSTNMQHISHEIKEFNKQILQLACNYGFSECTSQDIFFVFYLMEKNITIKH